MNTKMSLPGFSSPAAGPEAPLSMLADCHTRVERQCRTLERLLAHLPAHGSDRAAQEAAQAVLRYFDLAAPNHHADEEVNLFPALLEAMAGSDAVCIREITGQLCAEHRQMETLWARLRGPLQAVAEGQASALSNEAVQGFVTAYRAHIEREDREVLPMAGRLLGETALTRLGEAMRQRRGI